MHLLFKLINECHGGITYIAMFWQVDFSQSVHHLWKQYRRHGKAGGAEELAAANDQGDKERGGPQGALPGGLQLKPGAGGLYAGPAGEWTSEACMHAMPCPHFSGHWDVLACRWHFSGQDLAAYSH